MAERITLIEIDLDRCSNTYGVNPCTASLGVTGSDKCFNCFATCQDQPNYNTEIATSRYSTSSAKIPASIDAIPNIASVSYRPTKLELGESIGIRASINITFKDSRFPDSGPEGDRYLIDRDYDPYTRGSYWGKFRARWPYVKGSDIRLIRGDTSQTIAQMETRHFIVEKVAGPDSSGAFTIQCKDALQLADGKQSQAPLISIGAILNPLLIGETTFTVNPHDTQYDNGSIVNIGGAELCDILSRAGAGTFGDPFIYTINRGRYGTDESNHKADSRVQLCINYNASTFNTVTGIINDLLVNYANVPPSFIPLDDWTEEDSAYIARLYSSIIAEPTSVTKLINELLEQTASTIWWDDLAKLIRFKVLRAVNTDAAKYDENLTLAGSFSAVDQPEKRVSQAWTYYGQINPLEKLNDTKNYAVTQATVSPESELNFNGVPSIKRIFSRWIPAEGSDAANRLNNLILARYATPPRLLSFGLHRDSGLTNPLLGGGYIVESSTIQDFTGGSVQLPVQVVQVKSSDAGFSVLAEEVLYSETVTPDNPTVKQFDIPNDSRNINLRSMYNNIYPAPITGDTVNIFLEQGFFAGGSVIGAPSIEFGLWPELISINLIVSGTAGGIGGAGGAGGSILGFQDISSGRNGGDGGSAISIASQTLGATITIETTPTGVIGGGGGGGGGGGAAYGIVNEPRFLRLNYISGAGGSAGPSNAIGGAGGYSSYSGYDEQAVNVTLSQNGKGSTSEIAGSLAGGTRIQYSSTAGLTWVSGGNGGAGGDFGMAGNAGTSGRSQATDDFTGHPSADTTGGSGGLPGAAIVLNGNTVTITNNGTIAGAIVP